MQRRFALIGHVHALSDLTDLSITSPSDDSLLQYNSATGKWEDVSLAAFVATIDHGSLAGLADNDHPQYGLLAKGADQTWTSWQIFSDGIDIQKGYALLSDATGDTAFWFNPAAAPVDEQWWGITAATNGTISLHTSNDAGTVQRAAFTFDRAAGALTALAFGNSTDNPDITGYTDALSLTLGTYEWLAATSDGATAAAGTVLTLASDIYSEVRLQAYVNDNYGPTMTFYHSRGTKAVPTQALSGDQLGGFFWAARHDGGGWHYPASVDFTASSNAATVGGVSGTLDFKTGTTFAGLTSRLQITTAGVVTFPSTAATYDVIFSGYPQFQVGFQCKDYIEFTTDAGGADYLSWYWINNDGALNEKVWIMETDASAKYWAFRYCTDALGSYKNALEFTRSGNTVTTMAYGNSTDEPNHNFYGDIYAYDGSTQTMLGQFKNVAAGSYFTIQGHEWSENGVNVAIAANYGGAFSMRKSRGTLATPSAALSGDETGEIFWGVYGTSTWYYPAIIGHILTADASTTAPGYLYFSVSTNSTASHKLRLYSTGEAYWGTDVFQTFDEMTAPSTPSAGRVALYAKSDGLLYSKDDAGAETALNGTGAGFPSTPTPRWGDTVRYDGSNWVVATPATMAYFFEDFWQEPNATPYNGWDVYVTGAAATALGSISGGSYPSSGNVRLTTGTTTTGVAAIIYNQSVASVPTGGFQIGIGALKFRARVRFVTAVPDGTQAATFSVGLSTRDDGTTTAEACHFVYDNTNNRWYFSVRTGAVSTTLTPSTNVAATLNTFQTLEAQVAADGLSVTAYVDGVSIGTISSGLPTYLNPLVPHARYAKTAGTTSIAVDIDYIEIMHSISRG